MEKKYNGIFMDCLLYWDHLILARHNQVTPYQTDNGLIFGTVY